ncbi:MAG: hypothetical protein Q4D78_08715 [Neisseria zoodegmatis]|uniref:hypothetical protein n=1 Tax=Neisseria zoodegmatis TaxID=326523 RepID=UPI0026EEFF9A|nr:hypothetical protein [Neisseria zoodegmatis]MDO5070255.1 hypothetical protein [Neisseria zoodegmatis]
MKDFSLLTDRPLQEMINEFLNFDELQKSIPFYVSVFEQDNLLQNSLALGAAELFGIENKPSVFKHIQSLPLEQQKETILASAAIPLLFQSRRDENGTTLTDGGQGGWIKAQGNTPIRPLIDNGCKWVIVSHLSNGSLWHRHDFTDATCIEIRPNPSLDMGFSAMFDFSEKTIYKLVEAGYEDTMQQVGALKKTLSSLYAKRSITEKVEQIIKEKRESEVAMDLAMERLRNS